MDAEPIDAADDLAKRRVGDVLSDKWRLERLLGIGGMAAVYAAKHVNNERAAAIKVLHVEAALNAEVKRRFLREGYIANKVQHPGAVAVLDDGVTTDGAAYIVMELCQGQTLQEVLEKQGTCDEVTVLRWADALLDVLALAHREGIVHRDLKPDNVFVLHDGNVKVLDFGVARIEGHGPPDQRTQAGLVLGTPTFMPPEQARGQKVDGRADLWALGAIMVTALTGKALRVGQTTQECLFLAMTQPVKPMAEFAPQIAPRLAAILDKALAFNVDDRWQDASAMQAAVRALQSALARDPTLLKAPAKAAWPPPPVLPGPPLSPRGTSPAIPVSPINGSARVPTKVEPALEGPERALDVALRATMPAPADAEEVIKAQSSPPPASVGAAGEGARGEAASQPSPSPSPPSSGDARPSSRVALPPAHLQAEARSLEAGSPLLPENRRKHRRRQMAIGVGLLVICSFGLAFAIQTSQRVRVWLALEPPVSEVESEPPPPPVAPTVSAAVEEPIPDTHADAAAEADAGSGEGLDAAAPHALASKRAVTPAKPKPAPKKPAPKKRRK